MTINVAGAVLASILFEHSNSECDKEGLLLGKLSQITTDTISDSSLNNIRHQTVYYLHSYLPSEKLFTWYNSRGEVEAEGLHCLLNGSGPTDVIGWYKLRRSSSLSPSVRERAIHRHLDEWAKNHSEREKHLVFLLCVSQSLSNGAVYASDHQFMIQDLSSNFQNMSVTVMNLGTIAKPDYRTTSNFSCSMNSSYISLVRSLSSSFLNGHNELTSVKKVDSLKLSLHNKLESLCQSLTKSEGELAKEVSEIKLLKAQLQSTHGQGFLPSAESQSKSMKVSSCQGIGDRLEQNQMEVGRIGGKGDDSEAEEDRHLITFDDDDDDDDDKDDEALKKLSCTVGDCMKQNQGDANSGKSASNNRTHNNQVRLLDENLEDFDEVQRIDCEKALGEELSTTQQQLTSTDGRKPEERPFQFLDGLMDSTVSSYSLRSRSTVSSAEQQEDKSTTGRKGTRTVHRSKQNRIEEEISSEGQKDEAVTTGQRSRKNAQKVYERSSEQKW